MTTATLNRESGSVEQARCGIAARLLIVVMVAASFVLWIGIPLAGTWVAGELANTGPEHGSLSILFTVGGMLSFAVVLSWLNELYLQLTRGSDAPQRPPRYAWNRSMRDEPYRPGVRKPGDPTWRVRGPMELILSCSFVIALVVFLAWFFLLAENPPLVTFGGGYR